MVAQYVRGRSTHSLTYRVQRTNWITTHWLTPLNSYEPLFNVAAKLLQRNGLWSRNFVLEVEGRAMLRPTCFSVYSQRYAFISSPMNKWTSTSRQELVANLGIRVIIGMVDVPSYRDYWLANHVLCLELIAKVMTISPMCGKELHSCKTGCGNDQLSTPSITHSLL